MGREDSTVRGTPAQPASPANLPGCTRPVFVDPNSQVHAYCGQTHARAAGALAPLDEGISDDEDGSTPTAAQRSPTSSSTEMTAHPLHKCRGCWQSQNFGTTWTICARTTKTVPPLWTTS